MNNIYNTIKSNIPELLNELSKVHKEYMIVDGRMLNKDYILRRIIIMNKNNEVIERVNDIFKAVITDKKDMYLYILSVLIDENYDELKEELDNRNDNKSTNNPKFAKYTLSIFALRENVKKVVCGGVEPLSVPVTKNTILLDYINEKFATGRLKGKNYDIPDHTIFNCLYGYLKMPLILKDLNEEETN